MILSQIAWESHVQAPNITPSRLCTELRLIYFKGLVRTQLNYPFSRAYILYIDKKKCKNSIIALNYAASILFQEGTTELPSQMAIKRQELVNLLLQSKYLEAEERSLSLYE